MAKFKIIYISMIVFVIIGLCTVNINLNRQIYSSIAGDINHEDINYNKEKLSWNLDYMGEVLTYPDKYDIGNTDSKKDTKDSETVMPKIRILYNPKPFDFRIDTNNYIFFINGNVINNLKFKFYNTFSKVKTTMSNLVDNI
ncbi:MAG: hypothetical protein VB130_16915 [Clostridium sp.]|nr:hypothetical protein [Clostridium sp.]